MSAEHAAHLASRRAGQSDGQRRASDPEHFVWVAANAGSGKTHVLVQRLARLLLSGTPPTRILCLTFTNAAAAEMANRLYETLSGWAIATDADLAARLADLTGLQPDASMLARARRLFPSALESPGGLKIHTIHAFCERLLHRFPLEAGVSPHFAVIDERGQAELLDGAREAVMAAAADDPQLAAALSRLSALIHDISLADLLTKLVTRRRSIAGLDVADPDRLSAVTAWLAAQFEVSPDADEESLIAAEFADQAFDGRALADAAAVLAQGSTRDHRLAGPLGRLARARTPAARHAAHREAFLTQKGDPRAATGLMTKTLQAEHPGVFDRLCAELERAAALRSAIAATATLQATRALLVFADAVIAHYDADKTQRGQLDYDDLIARARNLLSRVEDAQWVLYKLDGGIDHILVDEAQDTSPDQWAIVQYLAEDMLSGATARTTPRTVFAVGDAKQSIFSFQGADPAMFAAMRDYFQDRTTASGTPWDLAELTTSYRSTAAVLEAVDTVFTRLAGTPGLGQAAEPAPHVAHRSEPGRVEVWETETPDETAPSDPWTAPLDYAGSSDPRTGLARRIAAEIGRWLAEKRMLEARGRPITPGDIMILVRRRNTFVDAMVRELKVRGIPVAGVDRIQLGNQIVVQDLIAIARFVLLPEDDLSLAALLKSPLIGLDDDDLFGLAHGRPGSLWQSLSDQSATTDRFGQANARLSAWLAMADQMPPFEFFARILATDGNRARIFARLGPEADDPINEFLNAAVAYEQAGVPSLEGFVAWLTSAESEVKRDMEHGQDQVRVMTVHGAKGLEANIVILPDTCSGSRGGRGPNLVDLPFPADILPEPTIIPVWPQKGGAMLPALAAEIDKAALREAEEHARLLYVAMTRARDWLVVTGYEGKRGRAEGCWYDTIVTGLESRLEPIASPDGSERWMFRSASQGQPPEISEEVPARQPTEAVGSLPDWARRPVTTTSARRQTLRPSHAGPPSDDAPLHSPLSEARERRFSRGLVLHSLLELLPDCPPEQWSERAGTALGRLAPDLPADDQAGLAEEVLAVLRAPQFAPFLKPGARGEVGFSVALDIAPNTEPLVVEGRVDRIAVTADIVHVLDYKTHRPAPADLADVPRAHVTQMALYRAALAQVFGRPARATLLWTDTGRFMRLPDRVLDDAFQLAVSAWLPPVA